MPIICNGLSTSTKRTAAHFKSSQEHPSTVYTIYNDNRKCTLCIEHQCIEQYKIGGRNNHVATKCNTIQHHRKHFRCVKMTSGNGTWGIRFYSKRGALSWSGVEWIMRCFLPALLSVAWQVHPAQKRKERILLGCRF